MLRPSLPAMGSQWLTGAVCDARSVVRFETSFSIGVCLPHQVPTLQCTGKRELTVLRCASVVSLRLRILFVPIGTSTHGVPGVILYLRNLLIKLTEGLLDEVVCEPVAVVDRL